MSQITSQDSVNQNRKLKPGPKKKIDGLSCLADIKLMIENGERLADIAAYIQDEAKEYTDVSRKSLTRSLYRYFNDSIRSEQVKELLPATMLLLKENLQEHIDPIHSLNILLAIQIDRIMIEYSIEKKLGKTINTNTKAISVAATISDLLNKATSDDLSRRLKGASLDSSPSDTLDNMSKVRESYAQKYGEVAANVIANPDSRRRILNIMEKIEKANSGPLFDLIQKRIHEIDPSNSSFGKN
ncbi:MAG: hypothetical protein KF789_09510 [Bdellovibrionaceae bacterium]|nr:hypothetical protein [Pseudobdellovibrionaceae bacterium]